VKTAGKCFWIGAALAACMASFAGGWYCRSASGPATKSDLPPFGPVAARVDLPFNETVYTSWPDCGKQSVFIGRHAPDLKRVKYVCTYTDEKSQVSVGFDQETGSLQRISILVPRQRTLEWTLRPDGSVASGPVMDLDDLKAGDIQLYDRRGKPTGRERSPKVHCVD
jgi:hypothetical protein